MFSGGTMDTFSAIVWLSLKKHSCLASLARTRKWFYLSFQLYGFCPIHPSTEERRDSDRNAVRESVIAKLLPGRTHCSLSWDLRHLELQSDSAWLLLLRVHTVSTHSQHVLSPNTLPRRGWARGWAAQRSLHRNASSQHCKHVLIFLSIQQNLLTINHITWICHTSLLLPYKMGLPRSLVFQLLHMWPSLLSSSHPWTIQTSTVHSCGDWHGTFINHNLHLRWSHMNSVSMTG